MSQAFLACTGYAASWCPNCGDCECPRRHDGEREEDAETCPLHGVGSEHNRGPEPTDDFDTRWRRVLTSFVPGTFGEAVQRGWIEPDACPPHEWDNRTSAENARWMLERKGLK